MKKKLSLAANVTISSTKMALKLQQQLKEVASKLENPPTSKDTLIKLLKQAATCLSELDQSPSASMLDSMQPFFDTVAKPELLKHQDRDTKLLVATCLCEITRITAPEAPYGDDVLKDTFHLIVSTFSGLSDTNGPSFGRRVVILETLARYRSCVMMLDLECYELINEMFSTFFAVASDHHPENVLKSMQTIMVVILEESEDVREDLLLVILSNLGRNKKDISMAARKLAMKVIEHSAGKLEPDIKQFLISSISGDRRSLETHIDYHEVIYDIYSCAPQILSGVVPYLTGELLTDQLDTRLKAVKLVGDLFALPGSAISEVFQPIFSEFLKRLTDRVVGVRMSVLEEIKSCLLSEPSRAEAPEIISSLCDRLLDYDENVRKQVVAVICDVACDSPNSIAVETVKLVAERLRDKSLLVKKYVMERLADIYRVYCMRCLNVSNNSSEYDWIPGKILRCFYDKDFRSDTIETVLSGSIFPNEFSTKDRLKHWVRVFSGFDKVEIKALEKMLEQKQRLQQEMQRYLSLRQMSQDGDAPEIQKKIQFCFRIMSRWFTDPVKAEDHFQILDQLKDANIWKILTSLLDHNTGLHQASTYRDDLLKILGEKHRLYDFLSALSVKCSNLLFNKEYVKELLSEATLQKSAGNTQYMSSCMNILVIIAHFSPLLLGGSELDLIDLLEDDSEIIKEGVLHVLAKAGGTIREQLGVSSSSIDLTLERLCLEGSRNQAKYAVHALAAITKDDGLKSLSVLYKRLVDMLEEKTHLPAVLQSLGCIAQTAMPIFETRESEIEDFIKTKILQCSDKAEGNKKACWDSRSELCSLKIYGIKTLVKSYLPAKDVHLRIGIDRLLEILRNIMLYGEIAKDIESSSVNKAHMRLASAKAVLRLAKHWDHKIPVDVFHLTLKTSEIDVPEAKKLFLSKVHQYVKDRVLDVKYACAFLINIINSQASEFEEDKHNLGDIIQMCHQTKAKQLSVQNDSNSLMAYPEYILPYLVHTLAHHSCPDIDECKDVKAFEVLYRQLYLFLSVLVQGDEDGKSEGSISKEKERVTAINSLLHSIKRSEDIVDSEKSKNSHAVCDLGLLISKRLAPKVEDLPELISPVPLPSTLYALYEKKEEDDSKVEEGRTWLADESVGVHFESLKIDTNGTADSQALEDDSLRDGERDGIEVPIGKMMKDLKSQGTKARRVMKKKPLPAEEKNLHSDDDIMKMVREINLDSLGVSSMFESSNGHGYSTSRKGKLDKKHLKRKRANASDATTVSVPKRRRSSSAHKASKPSLSRDSLKGSARASKDDVHQIGVDAEVSSDSENKMSMQKDMVDRTESDLLVSCLRKGTSASSKRKCRESDDSDGGEARNGMDDDSHDLLKQNVLVEADMVDTIDTVKGSSKKRKRRSLAGLAKCSSKGGNHATELIGCRIKVWWPMDKQFYEGVVKSYDSQKKKHTVLYNDGDVEVLCLEKERWELIDSVRKSTKKSNSSKSLKSVDDLPEPKMSGQQNKKVTKISSSSGLKGKRTPKKKMKHGQGAVSKAIVLEAESKESSDISDSEPTTALPVQDMEMRDNGGENVEQGDGIPVDEDDSEKIREPVSEVKHVVDIKSPNHAKESVNDEKRDSKGRPVEDRDSIPPDDTKESGDNEKSHLEEKEAEGSIEDSKEEVSKEEKSIPEEDQNAQLKEKEAEVSSRYQKEEASKEEKLIPETNQNTHLKERETAASSGDPKEDGSNKDNSLPERDLKTDDRECNQTSSKESKKQTSPSSDNRDSENSDDEPLSIWKSKAVGKSRRAG